ncbi:MAG: NFACT family protein, partial [Clostridia bacterium]|nr:NFACT family protein [Clostridia bacterium]
MSVDAYFIQGLCRELNEEIAGARIDKVNMPRKDQILLSLRTFSGVKKLMISVGSYPAVWITEEKYENPDTPFSFCMLLRKHLSSGRIISVKQPSHERIINLTVSAPDEMGYNSEKKIICEFIGRQKNLILVNEKGNIFACLRNLPPEGDRRGILPGLSYRMPVAVEKPSVFDIGNEELSSICSGIPDNDGDVFLCDKIGGITLSLSREALRSGDPAAFLRRIAENDPEPFVIYKGNEVADVSSFKPFGAAVRSESFSKALDMLYGVRCRNDNLKACKSNLNKSLSSAKKRIEKKIAEQKNELSGAAERDVIKQKADLITSNIYSLTKGQRQAEVVDYYDPSLPLKTIELDPLLTPQENAQKLYKKYEKLKNAEKHLSAQIEKGEKEL